MQTGYMDQGGPDAQRLEPLTPHPDSQRSTSPRLLGKVRHATSSAKLEPALTTDSYEPAFPDAKGTLARPDLGVDSTSWIEVA